MIMIQVTTVTIVIPLITSSPPEEVQVRDIDHGYEAFRVRAENEQRKILKQIADADGRNQHRQIGGRFSKRTVRHFLNDYAQNCTEYNG